MVRLARDLDRRDFIRVVTAGIALMPSLGISGLTRVVGPRRSRVALVRTGDRKRGVTAALNLLDLSRVKGRKVVVKPNFNSADDAPGSTHNDTLSQLLIDGRIEADPAKREVIYREAEEIVHADVPRIPVVWATSVTVLRNEVKGYVPVVFRDWYEYMWIGE